MRNANGIIYYRLLDPVQILERATIIEFLQGKKGSLTRKFRNGLGTWMGETGLE